MAIKEAIILAGGLGTRLRSIVSELPKCMAPVNNRPFLYYVIEHCRQQGIERFIFSVGYKYEAIEAYVKEQFSSLHSRFSIEDTPLGTGGAIKPACSLAKDENVLVLNGDTLFSIDVHQLSYFHLHHQADCSLSLKPMKQFDRYGVVTLDEHAQVKAFREKQYYDEGLINGGVYALNVASFMMEELSEKFSFEKDYLEQYVNKRKIFGMSQDKYFIDIGIPEDYERAQKEIGI